MTSSHTMTPFFIKNLEEEGAEAQRVEEEVGPAISKCNIVNIIRPKSFSGKFFNYTLLFKRLIVALM